MIKLLRPALLPCLTICIAVFASQSYAQAPPSKPDSGMVDAISRAEIVNALADTVRDRYVFPDVAERTEKTLRNKLKDGGYDSVKYAHGLAAVLTTDLQMVNHDLHLWVQYFAHPLPVRGPNIEPSAAEVATTLKQLKVSNFGVGTVKKLPGNIGYLEMREFVPVKYAKKTITAAMTRLAGSAALIIDLWQNGGGDPETVAFLSSYLFDTRTHLNDLYWREGERTEQFWTDEKVPGRKFGQSKPVYVITGRRTFSAAEEFGYNLQSLKRAIVVGEVTGGGAHPGDFVRLNANFSVFIPGGRAINPITKTNWEGTGVIPDVPVPAKTALLVTQKLALQTLSSAEKNPQKLQTLRARLSELDSQLLLAAEPFQN